MWKVGHWHCQDCCIFESLGITACSGYQRKAIGEQGIENRPSKAKASTPSTSIMLPPAAKTVRNNSLFEMQCTTRSVYCWVSSACLSGRTMESPQVGPAPLLSGFPVLLGLADNYSKRLLIPSDAITSAAIYKEKCIWIFQLALGLIPRTQLSCYVRRRRKGHLYGQALTNERPSSQKYFRHVALNSRN